MTRPLNIDLSTGSRYNRVYRSGDNSPRVNGVLMLRPNRFSYEKHRGHCFTASCDVWPSSDFQGTFVRWNGGIPLENGASFLEEHGWHTNVPPIEYSENLSFKLRLKVTNTDFNALVTAMEMKSTVVGLQRRASQLFNAYKALRHGDLKRFCHSLSVAPRGPIPPSKKVRNNISGHLLEYQFGLLPIYQDMYNGAVQIHEAANRQHAKVIRVSTKDDALGNYGPINRPVYPKIYGSDYDAPGRMASMFYTCESREVRRMYTTARVDNPYLTHISEFGFSNPAHAAWSVLPQSWIFDAFLPVGAFLQQLYMPPGISFHDTYTVSVRTDKFVTKYNERREKNIAWYMTDMGNNWFPVFPYEQEVRIITYPSSSEKVSVNISPHPFPGIQFELKPKLPFLGQAISMFAAADQQADALRKMIRRGA